MKRECLICGHIWTSRMTPDRTAEDAPKLCPRCASDAWNDAAAARGKRELIAMNTLLGMVDSGVADMAARRLMEKHPGLKFQTARAIIIPPPPVAEKLKPLLDRRNSLVTSDGSLNVDDSVLAVVGTWRRAVDELAARLAGETPVDVEGEQFKQEYEADESLQQEFRDIKRYIAYRRHEQKGKRQ